MATMTSADLAPRVAAMRRFSRFYTARIGALREGLHDSAFSLTEARILWELAHREGLTAAQLARELALDPGYLSRLLRAFRRRGLLARTPSADDGRQHLLTLTPAGRAAFAPLDAGSREEIGALLAPLSDPEQRRLVAAMAAIEGLLSDAAADAREPYLLREHRVGDIGWIVHRQAVLYAEEYGWDNRFEALLAEIGAHFITHFDPALERCVIAERGGEVVGSAFVVKQSARIAKLRMVYVEPSARGLGIGRRLVEECLRFARAKGYRKMVLWTNDILVSARRIYQAAGFTLVSEERHHSFGHDLVGQYWELTL
jgi:DNA-binding MarR family transcriptional regulator/N-acetylglutamate synthase-like GNAT family acetyltransferase